MKNLIDVLKNKLSGLNSEIEDLNMQIKNIEEKKEIAGLKFGVFQNNFNGINDFLKSYGLRIETVEGMNLNDDKELRLSTPLEMIGRRKPVKTYKDYDSRGGSKTAKKIFAQIMDIREKFQQTFPGLDIGINHFSFDRPNGILCDIWVK